MPCSRCSGLMVAEIFYDSNCSGPDDYRFEGWRCVCCGNVWDRVIAANRSRRAGQEVGASLAAGAA